MTQANTDDARDILIVGAGLAGLFLALKLSPRPCTIVSPAPIGQASSSAWAQGGLAAALDPGDNPQLHAADTIAAGAGLVDPVVADLIATDGPARVRDLLALGVPFDRTETGALALSLEAAHSRPRVARVAGDLAGKAIMDALSDAIAAADQLTLIEGLKAVGLLQDAEGRVGGVLVEDATGALSELKARETVMCAGGSGGLYDVTTNPKSSRGDGLAMAYTAGALVADPEFVQFHPTAIDVGLDPAPLATEALRGEGAVLRDGAGRLFMTDYHADGELAPRDEVARAIHMERIAGRGAFLDCTEAVGDAFPAQFPTVFESCQSAGIDPRTAPIPVAPAAHYHMGGVVSDLWGRTTLEGLSVCGESASTGAHGANRLASNSLLEAVVFADRIARRLRDSELSASKASEGVAPKSLAEPELTELRTAMGRHAGVARDKSGLQTLIDGIDAARSTHGAARGLVVADLIARAAFNREESRGGHSRNDYPDRQPPQRTFVRQGADNRPVFLSPNPELETLS